MSPENIPSLDNLGFDWRNSPAHLALLATFVVPRPPHTRPTGTPWEKVLGETPEKAIERFKQDKAIRPCGTRETLLNQLPKLTSARLKELLQERNLPMGKNKDEQVQILTSRADTSLLFDVPERYLLQCTDEGYQIVNGFTENGVDYLREADKPTADAVKKVLHFLTHDAIAAGIVSAVIYDIIKNAFGILKELFPDEQFSLPPAMSVEVSKDVPSPKPVPEPSQSTPNPKETPEFKQDRPLGRTSDRTTIPEMVRIPAGDFWMGSDQIEEGAFRDEEPRHRLYLPEYWIGRYLVMVAEFEAFVRVSDYQTTAEKAGKEHTWRSPYGKGSSVRGKGDHPVTRVSWYDALAYCRWLSEITETHYILPSEAEWEKAARGVSGWIYPWGDIWVSGRCNTLEAGKEHTTPVGYYSPGGDSPYGCADMAGNLCEWTRSNWGVYPYPDDPIKRSAREVLSSTGHRVWRGGYFNIGSRFARCAYRNRLFPDDVNFFLGFRVVVSPLSLNAGSPGPLEF